MNKIKPNVASTAFSPLFALQGTILTRIEMRTEYKYRWCWGGVGLLKGSSVITFRGETTHEPPSPNTWGELIPRGRVQTILQTQSFDKEHKNRVWGKVLQTAKINGLETGLIRTEWLPRDIIGFSTNNWFHTTNKFSIWSCVFSPEQNKTGVCLWKALDAFQQWCTAQVWSISTFAVMLAKIAAVLWGTAGFSWVTLRWISLALKYPGLFPSDSARVNISAVKQGVFFGFCSGVAVCAVWKSHCYCQRKIKTNLPWLITGYEY